MVDIIDIIVGKILSCLKDIYRILRLLIYKKYSNVKNKKAEKKRIESRFLRCKTTVLDEETFNKLAKKKKIKIVGSELYPIVYKPKHFYKKRNNNKMRKDYNGLL